ncbi:MAG: hypothetical protein ACO331_07930, partial [Prochlorothrix sp.]
SISHRRACCTVNLSASYPRAFYPANSPAIAPQPSTLAPTPTFPPPIRVSPLASTTHTGTRAGLEAVGDLDASQYGLSGEL